MSAKPESKSSSSGLKLVDFSSLTLKEKISLGPEETKKQFSKKAIAYLTGGMDSTALLMFLDEQPYNMDIRGVVFVLEGDANKKQVEATEYICKKLGATFVPIKVSSSNVNDVYNPEFYADYLIHYACQEQIKDIFIPVNNDEQTVFENCSFNVFNNITFQARKMKKCYDAGIPDIQISCPLNGQSKDAIIKKVLNSGKVDMLALHRSEPEDDETRKKVKYIRKLGFTLAKTKDPVEIAKVEAEKKAKEKSGNGK